MEIFLSAFAPENLGSRDGFGSPIPRQPPISILRLNLVWKTKAKNVCLVGVVNVPWSFHQQHKWSQRFGAKTSTPVARVALYLYPCFNVFFLLLTHTVEVCLYRRLSPIAEYRVGRYKFVWTLLINTWGYFVCCLKKKSNGRQHFVKRKPFVHSANQMMQNAKV